MTEFGSKGRSARVADWSVRSAYGESSGVAEGVREIGVVEFGGAVGGAGGAGGGTDRCGARVRRGCGGHGAAADGPDAAVSALVGPRRRAGGSRVTRAAHGKGRGPERDRIGGGVGDGVGR